MVANCLTIHPSLIGTAGKMPYLVPFSLLDGWLDQYRVDEGERLRLSYDDFMDIVRQLLSPVMVEEDWYINQYPPAAKEVAAGHFESPSDHFIAKGYFRGYQPFAMENWPGYQASFQNVSASIRLMPARGGFRIDTTRGDMLAIVRSLLLLVPVDDTWYRAQYPDAAKAIEAGDYESAAQHFRLKGYEEGYWPFEIVIGEEAYLTQYPGLEASIKDGRLMSGIDHFQRNGYREGRRPAKILRSDNPFYRSVLRSKERTA